MNIKKKILFLVTQSEFGGAQRFIYRLITNLDLAKYDILVAAGPEGNDPNGLLFTLKKEGFRIFSLKFFKRSINPLVDFWGLIEIYKLIKKEKPDIVFLCSSKAGFLGSLAAHFYRSGLTRISTQKNADDFSVNPRNYPRKSAAPPRVVYRIGGWSFNDPWPKWKKKLFILLEKWTTGFKDIIITNAETDTEQAERLGIKPKENIITIYNGISIEKLDFLSRDEAKIFLGIPLDFVIGIIANLYPTKGLEYLIQAANILKIQDTKYKILIIGEGQERKKLENLIKKYNLEDVIILAGAIPDAYKYLKAFDIFVLPSVKEGFPWTILEAMAAEVPVIATEVGAIPEIIENNKNGILIEPKNPNDLAESIKRLINDKNLREKLAKEARKTVEEKFRLDRMVSEIEKLFVNS
ncbi:MAG: glycosyltransferase family 4 protein [Patescibacteria group bacterium]